ncbi:MAG: hypothetical protein WAW36_04090 [Methylovulum miyakonense]|uniref:hypothetical protein n=1 Tax=Methylovulum miyakonense TaxID=645578 RepID=UPI003BB611A2
MRKIIKWQWFRIVLMLLLLLPVLGLGGIIWFSSVDNKAKIAELILYDEHNQLNDELFSKALAARFPRGTQLPNIEAFVQKLNGHCTHNGKTYCSFVMSSTFCVVTIIEIVVEVSAEKTVSGVFAKSRFMAC